MWVSKNSLIFSIETNWKSKYLQNKALEEENNIFFAFWVIYENIIQIYCFDHIIDDDLTRIKIINNYRLSNNVSLKITIDINSHKIIWILLF